jgi:putative flippase GtrA
LNLKGRIKTGGLVGILRSFRSYGIRYAVVGASGTIIYICLLKLFVDAFNADPVTSSVLSAIPSMIATYVANYFWTFQSSNDHFATLSRFAAISGVGLLLNAGIMHLCVDVLGLWYLFGAFINVVAVAVTNFLLHVYWSFRLSAGETDVMKKAVTKEASSRVSFGRW